MKQEKGEYRVLLIEVGDKTERAKESFCQNICKSLGISFPLMRKAVEHCPVEFKKNLSLEKAMALAKVFRSFGSRATVEAKNELIPIILEFQASKPHQLVLQSCSLRRGQTGAWNVIGKAKNISAESLNDTWVLIQFFDDLEEILAFEEVPIAINPLPSEESSPFKAVFEGDLPVKKVSVAFKDSSGRPVFALDRRKKEEEWVTIPMEEEEDEESLLFINIDEPPREMLLEEPPSELELEKDLDVQRDEFERVVIQTSSSLIKEGKETSQPSPEPNSLEMDSEASEKNIPVHLDRTEADGPGGVKREFMNFERGPSPLPDQPRSEMETEKGEEPEEGIALAESEDSRGNQVLSHGLQPEGSKFGETVPSSRVVSAKGILEEEISSIPWMDDFRASIDSYYLENRNPLFIWFESHRAKMAFESSFHLLLTILAHARFDQVSQPKRVLENTQRVFRIILHPNIPLEEIPSLEGTQFFSGDHWRDLFHRALPKLQEIAQNILEKERWNASELERLIQVIPHMSNKTSRVAVRWIHELIPDVVDIDFSNTSVFVGESLYRVACRLGIVDPYFDHYDSKNSAADTKIQTFAKEAFPIYPVRIEEPMAWIGMDEERGHCFPTQPRCEGCPFGNFCPRLYLHFNPSEKGMTSR